MARNGEQVIEDLGRTDGDRGKIEGMAGTVGGATGVATPATENAATEQRSRV